MKQERFIDYYYKFAKRGKLVYHPEVFPKSGKGNGLCCALPRALQNTDAWFMVQPSYNEDQKLEKDGYNSSYWAYGKREGTDQMIREGYTTLRQTILILAALLNGEEF